MSKLRLILLLVVCFLIPVAAQAQSVDLVYGSGRAFDIPSASWMVFHAPGVEVAAGDFVFNVTHLRNYDSNQKAHLTIGDASETDLTASYSRMISDRIKITGTAANWHYHVPFERKNDWRLWAEVRYNIYSR